MSHYFKVQHIYIYSYNRNNCDYTLRQPFREQMDLTIRPEMINLMRFFFDFLQTNNRLNPRFSHGNTNKNYF